ncbi:MAG TPA: PAS domain-containing protein, partial [Archangium sp.]|nr:PAS domain-containing protein [Archangium sp.]
MDAKALFAGGGEMGVLMHSIDWSKTELGAVEQWPSSLRTVVGLVLRSRFPMLLWWGPNLIQLYNDAYRPILGEKHPRAMGAPGHEVWKEIWPVIGPMAESIQRGGPATWNEHLLLPMQRKGFLEETYFTFSYSPVPAEVGPLGGVLVTCQETTLQVLSERRLRTVQAVAAESIKTGDAEQVACSALQALVGNPNDVPFALLYLLDPNAEQARRLAVVGVDEVLTGPSSVRVGGPDSDWPFQEVITTRRPVEVRRLSERFRALPAREGQSSPTRAVALPIESPPGGPLAGVLVIGLSAQLEFDEQYQGFLRAVVGHLSTAIQNSRAYQQIKVTRNRLHGLFQNAPAFVCTLRGPEHVFEMVNPRYEGLVGRDRQLLLGLPVRDALPEVVEQGFIELLDGVYRTGEPFTGRELPIRLARRGDATLDNAFATFVYQPTRDAHGQVDGIDVFGFEVTDQVQARQRVEALAEKLRESEERYRTLFESIDDGFCVIEVLFDGEEKPINYRFLETNATFETHTGLKNANGRTARELVPDLDESWFRLYGHVARTGETERFESHAPAMGRWFDVYASRVGRPELRQVALVFKDVTGRKAAEAERVELLAREQTARAQAEAERQKLYSLFMQAPVAISIHEGSQHTYTFANPAYRALVGGRDVVGKPLLEAIPELVGQGFDMFFGRVVATGESFVGNEMPARVDRKGTGTPEDAFYNIVLSPKRDAQGGVDGVVHCAFEVTDQVLSRQRIEAMAEKLRESEERLRRVVDASSTGIWELDVATQLITSNERYLELFGLPPGTPLTLSTLLETIHPDDLELTQRAISAALSGENGGRF